MRATRMTARAAIQEEALRLFAEHGADAVSLRQVAAAAGVSPALVVHHFGGKDGLRAAVDEHAAGICEAILDSASGPDLAETLTAGSGASMAETLLRRLPRDSPVPAYLRRLLLSGDEAGGRVFQRWYRARSALLEQTVAAGLARPALDHAVRTAFLVVNDLALLLLRDQLVPVLGMDPLSPAGLTRWADEALAIYRGGLLTGRGDDEEP